MRTSGTAPVTIPSRQHVEAGEETGVRRGVTGMQIARTVVFLSCVAGVSHPLAASTVLFRTDAELVALSERVVHGRVIAQRTTWGGPDGQRIYTVTTLAVLEDFGGREGDSLDIWELGGIIGDRFLYVGGAAEYQIGRDVLVCLERGPYGLRSVAMAFSKFDVLPAGTTGALLRRELRDTVVIGGTPAHEPTLAEFRALAERVTGRASRRRTSAVPQPQRSIEAPFTLLSSPGFRWVQADAGLPVPWYRNTTAPPPLFSGDAEAEIVTALAAWTSPPSAAISLNYGGTTFQPNAKGPWNGIPGGGVITFEDPYDEMAGGILAIGGGSGTIGAGGTIGGVTFDGFTHAYAIFQDAASLPASFRESLNFSRVLTHEIGHGIGLGHTQSDGTVASPTSNVMYPTCCHPGTPVPPAIGADDLAGAIYLYPLSPANAPTAALDPIALRFGAVSTGVSLLSSTSAQTVRLTQSGAAGTVTWTAAPTVPWLQVSPSSGTGPASISVAVVDPGGLPAVGTVEGAVVVAVQGAWNAVAPIAVTLDIMLNGTSAPPFGMVETPVDQSMGVSGAVPFTGWALDDVEVKRVTVCRAPVGIDPVYANPECGGTLQTYIGDAVFVDGARPDVQAAFPTYPRSGRAGWGFMVLTNMLPDVARGFPGGGNGTFTFSIYAQDAEGRVSLLGTRTLTCDNEHATKPFGAIDTPGQGALISGTQYVNFGWALTPNPKSIPADGSTITVFIDGVPLGNVSYNHFRSDIASFFPGLANSDGAVGFRVIDTTTLSSGVHTIAWGVADNEGAVEGIGSRYFTVANDAAAETAAASTGAWSAEVASAVAVADDRGAGSSDPAVRSSGPAAPEGSDPAVVNALPVDGEPIRGRRGFDTDAPLREYAAGARDRAIVRGEELDRFELHLGDPAGGTAVGYLRVGRELAPLPIGSSLDATTDVFTWAPGVGFVGTYELVFVRSQGGRPVARREVSISLAPKGRGRLGPQVVIDTPRAQQDVGQPFVLAGWAADIDAETGTGIDTLHVWAYPLTGGAPVFLGVADYGGARADVAAVHGNAFRESGYGLVVQGLEPGNYDLAVFAWSRITGGFVPASVVRVTVR